MTEHEVNADLASLKDDLRDVEVQVQLMPVELRNLWTDTVAKAQVLQANANEGAHHVAQRIYAFIKTS